MSQTEQYRYFSQPCQQGATGSSMPTETRTEYGNAVLPMGIPLVRNGGSTGKVRAWTTIVNGPICGFSALDETAGSLAAARGDANIGVQYPVDYPVSMVVKGDVYLRYAKTTPPVNLEPAYVEQGTGYATNDATNGEGAPNQPIGYFIINQGEIPGFINSQLVMTHVNVNRSGTLFDILFYTGIIT